MLALTAGVHAGFINLNPGGYEYAAPEFNPPPSLLQLINDEFQNRISFFDSATPNGWVSQFGVLNGGTYFFTNLINGVPLSTALVSCDFLGSPYTMRYVDVVGSNNGDFWESVYLVTGATRLDSNGWLETLLDETVIIDSIAFYGTTPENVPDSG